MTTTDTRSQPPERFPVFINNDTRAFVTLEGVSEQTVILHRTLSNDVYSWRELLEAARHNRLPRWAKDVPPLVAKIAALFVDERTRGLDPYTRKGVAGEMAFHEDLPRGVRFTYPLAELRSRLARGHAIPPAFDCEPVRVALGLTQPDQPAARQKSNRK